MKQIDSSFGDIETVELEPEVLADNFIAGRFDVIVNYDPQALRAEREGDGQVAATSASYEGVIPKGLVARADVLESIPEVDLSKIITVGSKQSMVKDPPIRHWEEYN